ncbi:MAG: integrase arm-type DNA-binding domain-containing protein [Candidatus Sphingomonas colombiensis]|nr:integrase arm-type DNA-binding domain-containing protein [Sphingomonas sp.]WEK43371.1 MAG: integrase arm-type DNA-binding domain-containing protein [Sphingomonas sp.]
MAVLDLTPAAIERLTSGILRDSRTPGLKIEAMPTGRKLWSFRRRVAGTAKTVRESLGAFPTYSIGDARNWAAGLNASIERGEDPRELKRAEDARLAMTVHAAHELYMAAVIRGDRRAVKPRTIADKKSIYSRDIGPRLGNTNLYQLTEDECWNAVYDKANASKDRANKMAGELACFLRWCCGREGRMAGIERMEHPAPTLIATWFSTGPKANTRFLDEQELGWLFQALTKETLFYRRGILLLLLTAARRNELFGASSCEFVEGIWTLPIERSKTGKENIVALGPWGRRMAQTNREWLFPSSRLDGPQFFGWFQVRDRLHARMEQLAGHPIARWHFHDFRRTFKTNSSRVGIKDDVSELMLNHKRTGVRGIYNKNEELEARAAGFLAWERFLMGIAIKGGVADALMCRSAADTVAV